MPQPLPRPVLLDEVALGRSSVVANCTMNRERQLAGVNSYARELGFNPLETIAEQIRSSSHAQPGAAAWLDLCCGSGRALVQTAQRLNQAGLGGQAILMGVDLVDTFELPAQPLPGLELVCASVADWRPAQRFDLITCVHGLHYIGDKLGLLARIASWLTRTGRLVADLDPADIRVDGASASRQVIRHLRRAGLTYNARRHQITCIGPRDVRLPYTYLGADDRAGPGYTGQPAVCSHYAESSPVG